MKPPRLIVTLTSTLVVLMSIGTTQSAQIAFTTPLRSVGNNFTMLSSDGSLIGGTNDVVFNWDGTLNQ